MLLLIFCPESPRYLLITRGWEDSARAGEMSLFHGEQSIIIELYYSLLLCTALIKLRNCANVEDDIEEMRAEDRAQQEDTQVSVFLVGLSTGRRHFVKLLSFHSY